MGAVVCAKLCVLRSRRCTRVGVSVARAVRASEARIRADETRIRAAKTHAGSRTRVERATLARARDRARDARERAARRARDRRTTTAGRSPDGTKKEARDLSTTLRSLALVALTARTLPRDRPRRVDERARIRRNAKASESPQSGEQPAFAARFVIAVRRVVLADHIQPLPGRITKYFPVTGSRSRRQCCRSPGCRSDSTRA